MRVKQIIMVLMVGEECLFQFAKKIVIRCKTKDLFAPKVKTWKLIIIMEYCIMKTTAYNYAIFVIRRKRALENI